MLLRLAVLLVLSASVSAIAAEGTPAAPPPASSPPAAELSPEAAKVGITAAEPAPDAKADAGPTTLDSPERVRDLCAALETTNNMHFTGEPSEIAEQRRTHEAERTRTIGKVFRVDVPSKGFSFGHYRTGQDEVELDGDRPLYALDGALALDLSGIDDVAFKSTPAQLADWSRLKKANTLVLQVTFRPAGDRCPGNLFARGHRLAGVPTAWRILGENGAVLGAADEENQPLDPNSLSAQAAAPKSVKVTRVTLDESSDESKTRLEGVQGALDRCMGNARRPGSMVVSFAVQQGRLTEPQVIMDAARDEQVSGCLARALAGAVVVGAERPSGRGSLTLSLQ
ncbi:MAG: hypothetical protein JST92_17570 [Deltaproteobacteria bacterium]|nr:hypothetical protein [Deltaproteobacteria bacterium]